MAPDVLRVTNANHEESDLDKSLHEIYDALGLFFTNKFDESKKKMYPGKDTSLIHSIGYSIHHLCYAIFTMEKPLVDEALIACQDSIKLANSKRKKNSMKETLSGLFSKTNYADYTDEEAHAELCHAEANFLTMILSFVCDPSFRSLIRGAKCFLACHSAAKIGFKILEEKTQWESEFGRRNFECGVHMGMGCFNLVFSHLPARVLRIISIVGFTGDREVALKSLRIATLDMTDCVRNKISSFLFCMYSFYLEQFFGVGELDAHWIKQITQRGLEAFPDGAFDLYWSAKFEQLKGHSDAAAMMYERCISVQDEFPQMHNVCRWDLLWCYAINCDWRKAADCAKVLQDTCLWSPATNCYQYACFMHMIMVDESRPELAHEVDQAMGKVIDLRKRYGGKTLPPEKFAVVMATRYNEGDTDLVLPAFVLFYIWNIYGNSTERPEVLDPLLSRIVDTLRSRNTIDDNYYVLTLLKGVCLRNMKRTAESIECFHEIINAKADIRKDNYVPPHAAFELGMAYKDMGDLDNAKTWLTDARDSYSGFLVETLVHLRIHGALNKLKETKNV